MGSITHHRFSVTLFLSLAFAFSYSAESKLLFSWKQPEWHLISYELSTVYAAPDRYPKQVLNFIQIVESWEDLSRLDFEGTQQLFSLSDACVARTLSFEAHIIQIAVFFPPDFFNHK